MSPADAYCLAASAIARRSSMLARLLGSSSSERA
jgi:hypothetical protein